MIYSVGGVANIVLAWKLNPDHLACKITMIVLLLMQLLKSFFYLRIFDSFSYIVTMISQVMIDLRVFMSFYVILIFVLSLIYAVIGLGNRNWGPTDTNELGSKFY